MARAIAWAEGFSARLGSWPFLLQLEIKNWLKASQNSILS